MRTGKVVGRVVSFNSERGFGFIKLDEGFKHVWFHVNECRVDPKIHLAVQFEVADSPKGPVARNVEAIADAIAGAAESLAGAGDKAAS